jgi:outer membrane protein OmpA-like peptidoglycan-associated protein
VFEHSRVNLRKEGLVRKFFMMGLFGILVICLAACATNTGKGAAIGGGAGAATGAGVGAIAGGGKGALIGAGIGAAVGAGAGALIGHYMDKQQEELAQVKSANVERQGDQLVVKFNSAILFDTGKTELKAQSQKDLADFAVVLKKYPQTDLIIEGHTDSVGGTEMNQKLSEARAHAVVSFLEGQGVQGVRMKGLGYGETRPVADNGTEAGRAQNRRVQVNIAANEELKKQDAEAASTQPKQ